MKEMKSDLGIRAPWWCTSIVFVTLALFVAGSAGFAGSDIRIFLNGKQLELKPAPRVEQERVVAPISPIAEALDCDVKWDLDSRTISITRVPFILIDHGEPAFGIVRPYSFIALAPIICLRHHLGEIQWASLNNPKDFKDTVLARYEIIDAYNLDFNAGPVASRPTYGFAIQAILYWLLLDPTDEVPPDGLKIIRHVPPGEQEEAAPGRAPGMHPLAVRVERVEYQVVPTKLSDPVRDIWPDDGRPAQSFIQSGWKVKDEGRVLHCHVVSLARENTVLPLYDLSVQKKKEADPNPEARSFIPWSDIYIWPPYVNKTR